MGMGLLGAVGGLAEAGGSVGKQMMQAALKEDEINYLQQKQLVVDKAREQMKIASEEREEVRRLAPVNRANEAIKSALNTEVPVAPERVQALTGKESEFRKGQGLLAGQFSGDPIALIKSIQQIKDDGERSQAIEAFSQQVNDAHNANVEAVAGKTRKLNNDEAMAVAERNLAGDLQAQGLLKAAKADKFMKIGANDTLIDSRTGQVVYQNKQGEENLKAMFENKLELAKAVAEFKAQLGAKSGELPSDAKMAQWLVSNGVAPDMKSAYDRVKQGKDKDDIAIQASIFAAINKDGVGGDPATLWKKAGEMVSSGRAAERGDQKPAAAIPKIDTLFPVRK